MAVAGRWLILDSNYLRGIGEGPLDRLRSSGFRLSVSVVALEEALARAHREGNVELLRKRVRKLSGYLAPERPVTPVGTPLYYSLGASFGSDRSAMCAAYNRELPERWRKVASAEDDASWRQIASVFDRSINSVAATFASGAEDILGGTHRTSA